MGAASNTGMCTSVRNTNLLTGHMFTKSNPNISKTLFHTRKKKTINSLQITRTVLIILHNSHNDLCKMNSSQERLLYHKKNNKKQLFGHDSCKNVLATIRRF